MTIVIVMHMLNWKEIDDLYANLRSIEIVESVEFGI